MKDKPSFSMLLSHFIYLMLNSKASMLFHSGGFLRTLIFFFSSRRRHTRCLSDWSSDVCSSDLALRSPLALVREPREPRREASEAPTPHGEHAHGGPPAHRHRATPWPRARETAA